MVSDDDVCRVLVDFLREGVVKKLRDRVLFERSAGAGGIEIAVTLESHLLHLASECPGLFLDLVVGGMRKTGAEPVLIRLRMNDRSYAYESSPIGGFRKVDGTKSMSERMYKLIQHSLGSKL